MEYLEFFSKIFSSIGGLGFLIGLVILYKVGLLEFLIAWKKNGKNGNKNIEEIKTQIDILEGNHMHEIKEILNQIRNDGIETKSNTQKEIFLLEDIRQLLKELK